MDLQQVVPFLDSLPGKHYYPIMNIPGYKLISKLGEGGMATVFLALQESLDREVAIKIMDPKMADDQSFCDRFIKEGRIVAQLSNHPDIVTVYDIGRAGDHYYMAMEYIPGPNLKDRIYNNDNPKLPLLVIRQVASALGMAHSRGFIHRDVKPANILFKENGDAVLSDFGIAKAVQADTQLTAIGYAVGTPEYMSPEQAMGQPVDARADIYCLGVVLFEMLAEKKPYVGQDPFSTALMHINNPIPQLPETFQYLQPFLDKLMAKNRDERFQTAEDVIAEVDRHSVSATQATIPITGDGASSATNPVEIQDKSNSKLARSTILGIASAAAVVVAAGYFLVDADLTSSVDLAKTELVAAPVARNLSTQEQMDVDRLLDVADAHMSIERYIEPPGSNAIETYKMVLEIDPANSRALDAITKIESQIK